MKSRVFSAKQLKNSNSFHKAYFPWTFKGPLCAWITVLLLCTNKLIFQVYFPVKLWKYWYTNWLYGFSASPSYATGSFFLTSHFLICCLFYPDTLLSLSLLTSPHCFKFHLWGHFPKHEFFMHHTSTLLAPYVCFHSSWKNHFLTVPSTLELYIA